jgi:hypothetical protein
MRALFGLGMAMLAALATTPAWSEPAPATACLRAMQQQPAIVAGRHHQPTIAEIARKTAACAIPDSEQHVSRPRPAIG